MSQIAVRKRAADRLYELLPAIHRIRDAEQGYPLRELISIIAEQVEAFEENLEQLYDDQFIETCAEWVAPYIGDLIGYRSVHGVVPAISSPRADVANTIRYRRRKGTASMLEQMARDVTGWPARVVEFFQLLGCTQYMNHIRPEANYAPDMRQSQRLTWRDTAFDTLAHTVDVRQIGRGAARHNIPNIGLYLWRVRSFPLTGAPAHPDPTDAGGRRYRFDPLGRDMALYNLPVTEDEITHLAEPENVPMPLGRRRLAAHLDAHYGPGRSLSLALEGAAPDAPPEPIASSAICVCDLSDIKDAGGNVIGWAHQPAAGSGKVAIDPVLGRIYFADPPARNILASFHYGFTMAIGGGEYERGSLAAAISPVRNVNRGAPLQPELNAVQAGGAVEVTDSGLYAETPVIKATAGSTVVLRAVNGARPLLSASGDILFGMDPESTVILDGWVIAGGTLRMDAFADTKPRRLILRDCTLVPGPRPQSGGVVPQDDDPGLVVRHAFASIELERCIVGPLHIVPDAEITLRDCIIDATAPDRIAFRGPGADPLAPGGNMTLERCTVIGKVHAQVLSLATDSLFVAGLDPSGDSWSAPLWADRRQEGCVRFSYVPPGSQTPRRYQCQPSADHPDVRPHFTSLNYGDAGYCQLRPVTSAKIRQGAHDESEMGVMHDLYQPQRETNLRVRLEEYLRFGLEAGFIYAS